MTLYDYLITTIDGGETSVHDIDYDIGIYFYNSCNDKWDEAVMNIAKLLNVIKIHNDSVEVDLSKVIEKNIEKINSAGLFSDDVTTDDIIDDIEKIFAGYVSEGWFLKFADTLTCSNE